MPTVLRLLAAAAATSASAAHTCADIGCGHHDSVCWCEASCISYDDCCPDYASTCTADRPAIILSDVNIVYTTDLHSWIEGRVHNSLLNATLGHAVSLVERLREIAAKSGKDVFFLDNGDINDGTGLSATAHDHVDYLAPLLRKAGYDALSSGNHELYQLNGKGDIPAPACGIAGLNTSGFIASWDGRYLTSNIVWAGTSQPVGSRYTVLTGAHGTSLLTFGFLYDMPDHCDAVDVERVEDVVKAAWFLDALSSYAASVDAIVLLVHMDYRESLIDTLLAAIRASVGPTKPVQFLAGHSHLRGYRRLDAYASSYEAGCKLDTLGFISFPTTSASSAFASSATFHHADLDGNSAVFAAAANASAPALITPAGQAVNVAIEAMRHALSIDMTIGCAPTDYKLSAALDHPDSLFGLYMDKVLPSVLFEQQPTRPQWALVASGTLSGDIHQGAVTADDVFKASPWGNFWYVTRGVKGATLQQLLRNLGSGSARANWGSTKGGSRPARVGHPTRPYHTTADDDADDGALLQGVPSFMGTGTPDAATTYDLLFCDFDLWAVQQQLQRLTGSFNKAAYRWPALNTSSVLVEYFKTQPC